MMLWKCCTQYASKFGNSAVATGLEKVSFHSNPKERQYQRMLKLPHNCTHLTRHYSNAQNSPSQASAICEPWTSRCSSCFLEKAEEPEIKLPTSAGSWKKQESSRKTSIVALLTMPKPLTVWITINCGKFWKRWEYQTTWSASWEIRSGSSRSGMQQVCRSGSNS